MQLQVYRPSYTRPNRTLATPCTITISSGRDLLEALPLIDEWLCPVSGVASILCKGGGGDTKLGRNENYSSLNNDKKNIHLATTKPQQLLSNCNNVYFQSVLDNKLLEIDRRRRVPISGDANISGSDRRLDNGPEHSTL